MEQLLLHFVQTNPCTRPGPYSFRVTDSYGNVLVDTGIPHVENGTVNGAAQFPPRPIGPPPPLFLSLRESAWPN